MWLEIQTEQKKDEFFSASIPESILFFGHRQYENNLRINAIVVPKESLENKTDPMKFFLNRAELSSNSVNSGNLINH